MNKTNEFNNGQFGPLAFFLDERAAYFYQRTGCVFLKIISISLLRVLAAKAGFASGGEKLVSWTYFSVAVVLR